MGFDRAGSPPPRSIMPIASLGFKRNNDTQNMTSLPLAPSKLINQQLPMGIQISAPKKTKDAAIEIYDENQIAIDKLLSHLIKDDDYNGTAEASDIYPNKTSKKDDLEAEELARLKRELEAAKSKIAIMDQQLSHRSAKSTPASTPATDGGVAFDNADPWKRAGLPRSNYPIPGGNRDDLSDSGIAMMSNTNDSQHGVWLDDSPALMPLLNTPVELAPQNAASQGWGGPPRPQYNNDRGLGSGFGLRDHGFQGPWQNSLRIETNDNMQFRGPTNNSPPEQAFLRGSLPSTRPSSAFGPGASFGPYPGFNGYGPGMSGATGYSPPITPLSMMQGPGPATYQPRPIGTPLSPTALEFSAGIMGGQQGPWNAQSSTESTSGYVPPMEPLNYRRLLDRSMNCNWKYIVDKIVVSNDQQASIFLQQKLKVSSPEQKFELVEAIVAQAYQLMINRFGNFLVQRCFEHGTPEQIVAIANAIRGNTLQLSMDPFGCHVVQKAFDVVPEDCKAIMVHELLRRIPETVIHRYACHVWQKLFELRWSDSPPQIMKYVNEALRGMWHEVALGETGSLVVQNIFENCLEEDKRPCINEVLGSIDVVSHGQFGNWCIQHICEHGAGPDKTRAIEHVLRYATEYSTDQFASKVVEKCLKVSGTEFLDRYLEKVCEGRADRPRMPLIDIAGDQYGNYLVQYILINADGARRDIVGSHIRKHMVSLRGSKFGSRVAMLCSNPASATRPGPGIGVQGGNGNRYMQPGMSMHGPSAYKGMPGY